MGYCRASAVRLLEKELLSGKHKNETEAVNAAIDKKCNDMIVKYFV